MSDSQEQQDGRPDDAIAAAETVATQADAAGESPAAEAPQAGSDPAAPVDAAQAAAAVEAILFTCDAPLPAGRLAQVAQISGRAVKDAIAALNARYEQAGSAFRIETIAGGYQMLTLPAFHDVLTRLFHDRSDSRLSQAAMETLAIVAYRQPILRADIEAIRGVACGEVLRSLMEKQLVKIVGRAEVLGRPMLYGTTKRFLEIFGLSGLSDLPRVEELRSGAAGAPKPAQAPATPDAETAPSPENQPVAETPAAAETPQSSASDPAQS
ncbi:MAG: SMC-Scp complex subunit ScpB [Phycisphaerae bacterium]|jgi:segregation and condensation protein B